MRRYEEVGCDCSRLEREIVGARSDEELLRMRKPPGHIERRVLKRLIDGKTNTKLSVDQLLQLDAYFSRIDPEWRKHRLTLECTTLFELAEAGRVTIWDGKRPPTLHGAPTRITSCLRADSDLEAGQFIERQLREHAPEVRVARGSVKAPRDWNAVPELVAKLQARLDGATAVGIGSPMVAPVSELLFCGMADILPFRLGTLRHPELPVRFVYPADRRPAVDSSFAVLASTAREQDARMAKSLTDSSRGLLVLGQPYLLTEAAEHHGLIAMQHRENGGLWVVACGADAAGTLTAAAAVPLITQAPQPARNGRHGAVLWCLVRSCTPVEDDDFVAFLEAARPEILETQHWTAGG